MLIQDLVGSSASQPSQGKEKDPLTLLIERNPCQKCRILRLPVCKCKSAGGEDDGEDESKEDKEEEMDDKEKSLNKNKQIEPLQKQAQLLTGKNDALSVPSLEGGTCRAFWIKSPQPFFKHKSKDPLQKQVETTERQTAVEQQQTAKANLTTYTTPTPFRTRLLPPGIKS